MSISCAWEPHAGWSEAERARLFALANDAREGAKPLRAVFDLVAAETGRKPNSVRNYYYAALREADDGIVRTARRAFSPFTGEEAHTLMRTVLSAQAAGESVRSCTLRLAEGDDKRMLRYQNKYRSMLKNCPAEVRGIVEAMRSGGGPVFDPYADRGGAPRVGRPSKQKEPLEAVAARTLASLGRVPGLNVNALLESLGSLALSATDGVAGRVEGEAAADDRALRAENAALKAQLSRQHERYRTLLGYFSQLVRLNTEFLSLNSKGRVSRLQHYLTDLESNVRTCAPLVSEAGS